MGNDTTVKGKDSAPGKNDCDDDIQTNTRSQGGNLVDTFIIRVVIMVGLVPLFVANISKTE